MEMSGERTLAVGRATAWAALNDVRLLQAAIPGCESIVASGDGGYDLAINAAIGPVKARFKGRMTLADIDAPRHYTIRFEGQGGQAGFARGDARITLEEQGSRQTLLRYAVTAQVGGRLAQVGSRLIDAASAAMADQFFAAFSRLLGSGAAPAAGPAKFRFWSLLAAFLRRLLPR
jgi:carbon monoxide dehydrogenase subunit G